MKHLSLFNGIGGFQLAASWCKWQNVAHVEIDDWCNSIVAKHFPESQCFTDIKQFDGTQFRNTIDIISGGFPCQPFSVAGKQRGKDDDRFLWPEMFRVICEVQPTFVVAENVPGLINQGRGLVFKQIIADLENEGFEVLPFLIPALGVGAWHQRERLWIIAYSEHNGCTTATKSGSNKQAVCNIAERAFKNIKSSGIYSALHTTNTNQLNGDLSGLCASQLPQFETSGIFENNTSDPYGERCEKQYPSGIADRSGFNHWEPITGWVYWATEPGVGRVANGVPNRVDRIKALGNAIVPQVAYQIFKAIDQFNNLI